MTEHAGKPRSAWAVAFPWLVILGCVIYLVMPSRQPIHDGRFDLDGPAKLPVSYRGRVKPFDAMARALKTAFSNACHLENDRRRRAARQLG